jgi:hypothetical protein
LLEAPYFHVVFTLPSRIGAIAFQNKAVIYDLLCKASAETLLTIAADPKRLGVKIGFTSVLHTWGFRHDPPSTRAHDRGRTGRSCPLSGGSMCRSPGTGQCCNAVVRTGEGLSPCWGAGHAATFRL